MFDFILRETVWINIPLEYFLEFTEYKLDAIEGKKLDWESVAEKVIKLYEVFDSQNNYLHINLNNMFIADVFYTLANLIDSIEKKESESDIQAIVRISDLFLKELDISESFKQQQASLAIYIKGFRALRNNFDFNPEFDVNQILNSIIKSYNNYTPSVLLSGLFRIILNAFLRGQLPTITTENIRFIVNSLKVLNEEDQTTMIEFIRGI